VNPTQGIIVSITQFHAGENALNAIPDRAILRGTARSFAADAETSVPAHMRRVIEATAAAYGATAELHYDHRYPVLVSSQAETDLAARVAAEVVGADKVNPNYPRIMASEDFSFMLNARPGSFVRIGSGPAAPLHSPHFDFNDAALPIGASFWGRLVETVLAK
jgi:hippurate hydrolase